MIAEHAALSKIRWQYLVVDEAHKLKNTSNKIYVELMALRAAHSTLLTGTPVQNNVKELVGLLSLSTPSPSTRRTARSWRRSTAT